MKANRSEDDRVNNPENKERRSALWALVGMVALLGSQAASAQSYPTRPVRLIVGYAAGGPVDRAARILAPALEKHLGQTVVVENQGGASGTLAGNTVARAAPDGYTLFFAASATQTMAPHVQKSMPYDPLKDYTPVSLVVNAPNVLVVNAQMPVNNVKDLIAYAKAHPQKVTFGSAGPGAGNHLAGELLAKLTGAPLLHVPYKGNAPAMTDVMSGQITFMFDAISTGKAAASGDRVKLLAITAAERHPLLQNVPTIVEEGIADFVVGSFYGIEGPPNIPAAVVAKLNAAVRAALQEPELVKRMTEAGYEVMPSSPQEQKAMIEAEYKRWADVTQGLKFE